MINRLEHFRIDKSEDTCPHCGEDIYCDSCGKNRNYCENCGEELEKYKCFLVTYTAKAHGVEKPASDYVDLIINGKSYASVHITQDNDDPSGDVAYLHLCYIPKENINAYAEIIAKFAKWARFSWFTADKKTDLPTLVRLLGFRCYKNRPFPHNLEKFIALRDATKIKADHLKPDFTQQDIET